MVLRQRFGLKTPLGRTIQTPEQVFKAMVTLLSLYCFGVEAFTHRRYLPVVEFESGLVQDASNWGVNIQSNIQCDDLKAPVCIPLQIRQQICKANFQFESATVHAALNGKANMGKLRFSVKAPLVHDVSD
jgi:hypothetical protein